LQLDSLDRYAASERRIDCLAIGNSATLMGIDPEALAVGYRRRSGRRLRCFNFGVGGMTASAAGAAAAILVDLYRPRLLVYVVSVRDVAESVDGPLLTNTPWVRYRRGTFSVDGWLTDHSAAFRYYLLYRQWLDPSRWPGARSSAGTTRAGFFPIHSGRTLSPHLWAHTQRTYADLLRQPPSPRELAGFAALLNLSQGGTQVVVVEAPAHDRLRRWARRSGRLYADATARMRQGTTSRGVRFLRAPRKVIPANGWTDFVHLNALGAARYSEWLGERLGAGVRDARGDASHLSAARG
jgi:hypothetical protein